MLNEEPRIVDTPPDLMRALEGNPEAQAAFQRLSYSHKKEYLDWITEARREETRQRRIGQMPARLREGQK
jgi:uncharacterized protein YdeI (YjbR/CyaY-like superfamily)